MESLFVNVILLNKLILCMYLNTAINYYTNLPVQTINKYFRT